MSPEHPEARRVVRLVLDVRREHGDAVNCRGDLARDRRGVFFLRGEARSLGVAGDGNARNRRQVAREPLRALRKRLRMRVDLDDAIEAGCVRQQVLLHAQLDLAADRKLGRVHQVERAADGALRGVLDGNHAVVGPARLARAENLVDARARQRIDELAEMLADGRVAERARRTEVCDAQALLECQACRHHLAEDADDRRVGQRAAVALAQPREHLRLAVGAIRGGAAARLQLADRLRVHGALIEAREDFAVEDVDRFAVDAQPRVGLVVLRVVRRLSHESARTRASTRRARRRRPGASHCRATRACRPPRGGP